MKLRLRRIGVTLVACIVATIGVVAVTTAPAYAAGCYGHSCNYRDPQAMGCASGAQTIDEFSHGLNRVELRYSPSCFATWVRVTHTGHPHNGYEGECHEQAWLTASTGYQGSGDHYSTSVCIPDSSYQWTGWTAMFSFNFWVQGCAKLDANHTLYNWIWPCTGWH
jgi:Protein of unknown function (DUF2690)